MQTNTTIIVEPTMEEAINDVIQMAKDDYFKWTGHGRAKTEVDNNMIKEFNEGFRVLDNDRRKFIKIVQVERNGSRRVWGFIMKHDYKHFKRGDILKAAGWNAPALNKPRGNIFNKPYKVSWTGPEYLR